MPFDGLAMRAVTAELAGKIIGGRVEKVMQPERDEVHLVIRNNYQNFRLLASASAGNARVHLTGINKANPDKAPMFCMLLRKHLTGGKVLSVTQQGLERVLDISFGVIDELGLASELTLHVEIMGRHSNAVLTGADGIIIDSVKRVTEEKSRVREVLPGLRYAYPPAQAKANPLELDVEGFTALLRAATDKPMAQALCDGLAGLSFATGGELLRLCDVDPALAASELNESKLTATAAGLHRKFANFAADEFNPVVLTKEGEAFDFLPFATGKDVERPCGGMSEAAEAFFAGRDKRERLRQSSSSMTQVLNTALARAKKKLEKQLAGFEESAGLETYRLKGELLTANLHAMQKGLKSAEVVNYYSETAELLAIELDPMLTPAENAQHYYKRYAKAKSAQENLKAQIQATHAEIDYIESQLVNIELSQAEGELDEIRLELAQQGYLRDSAARSRKKITPSKPHHYRTADGYEIFVGRNNLQNDQLTLKFARNDDVWMHTKEIPGSHVIIKAQNGVVSDAALRVGAMLAATFSKAKDSSSVPVDYTQRRNVKKPSGARPGFVIYLTNRTITVTPGSAEIAGLEKVE